MTAALFEDWLRTQNDIFSENYMPLLLLDYKKEDDCIKAKKVIRQTYDLGDTELIFKHKALETTQAMLDSSISLERGCQILAKMRNEGMDFVPVHFVGYDSEFTDKERSEMFDMLAFYSERIRKDCFILRDILKAVINDASEVG